jgi:hypothetical protein
MAAELGLNVKLAKEQVYYTILVKFQMPKVYPLLECNGQRNMVKKRKGL